MQLTARALRTYTEITNFIPIIFRVNTMKNTILLSIFILSIFNTYSQSTGATPANTVVSDNSNGENDGWANMGNIAVSDNSKSSPITMCLKLMFFISF